jgi:hypothetical protein
MTAAMPRRFVTLGRCAGRLRPAVNSTGGPTLARPKGLWQGTPRFHDTSGTIRNRPAGFWKKIILR